MFKRIRYGFIIRALKLITPALYYKLNLMRLIGHLGIFGNKDVIDEIPRPSIKRMKVLFDGRVVEGAEIGVRRGKNSKKMQSIHE